MTRVSETKIDVYARGNDVIGEGALWSADKNALFWIDIAGRRVYRRGPADTQVSSWSVPDYPGCLAEVDRDHVAVAMGEGVHQLDLRSGAIAPICATPQRRSGTRFNDGKVDPRGRLWVGTMQNNFGPAGEEIAITRFDGALFRFDCDEGSQVLEEEIGIANTLAWSPDLKRFYFGDSLRGIIYVYDFDASSGGISNRRPFYIGTDLGIPDGSAIDVDGCLWNVRWDGGAIVKITPEGQIDRVIDLPIPRPTSCSFGGADLRTLFITSARNGLTAAQLARAPLSGSVFAIQGLGQGVRIPPMRARGMSA